MLIKIGMNKIWLIFLFVIIYANFNSAKTIIIKSRLTENLNKAKANDTLVISGGYYKLDSLILNKPLTIKGINSPVFDGNGKHQILIIKSDDVTIEGIVFKNSGVSFISDNSAIKLDGVKNCRILNNEFINNFFGIYISKSSQCLIQGNKIKANAKRQTLSGNGIHLWYSRNIKIYDNTIDGQRDGIYLEFARQIEVKKNISRNNLRYGLHYMFSDSCSYTENIFEHNNAGVAVMYTKNVLMRRNRFINNWGSGSFGLLLKEISNSEILNNYFYKNTNGIYFEACNRISVTRNRFSKNGWAVRLMGNSMENKFEENNFIFNTFDVSTNSRNSYNYFSSNFWSEYNGYDLNKDGFGDVPFRPVRMFSIISEQNRPTLILLNSLIIRILDFAEKIFPQITPFTLADNSPRMREIYD